jgi:hypothetical protein
VVDVTESPIERRKKTSELTTVAKKGGIPRKAQVVVDQATGQIICTAFGKGRVHDFRLFKLDLLQKSVGEAQFIVVKTGN